jgi:integrase
MNQLAILQPVPAKAVSLADTEGDDDVRDYVLAEKAQSSRRAYALDFRYFSGWCLSAGLDSLPALPKTLARYLTWLAKHRGLKAATIARRAAAVRYVHQISGHASPTDAMLVKATIRGIRRTLGAAPTQKAALVAKQIGLMLDTCDGSLLANRDRALLALGFAAALRRSELVALQVEDLTFVDRGLDVRIRRSKGDQEGKGVTLAVPHGDHLMPVEAVQAWLTASGIATGPVFRPVRKGSRLGDTALTPHAVGVLAKKRARLVGIDPATISGHSLRAGYVTSCVEHGVAPMLIAEQSRHKSLDMLLVYSRRVDRYRQHSGKAFL